MRRLSVCVLALYLGAPAHALDWNFGGHAKYQYTYTDYRPGDLGATLADDPASNHDLDLRLKADGMHGAWDVVAHYELLARQGDSLIVPGAVPLALFGAGTAGLPDDRRRLLDLTDTVTDRPRTAAVHRFDRLAVGHGTPDRTIRVGRQAITWGNGLVFYPLDFVNPFSPVAIDKEYKTGDDMLYAQWALAADGEIQTIVAPRRDVATHDVESDQSTYAAKLRLRRGGFDIDLVAARHVGDGVAGLGLARSIGGAVWRLDASYTDVEDGVFSYVTNLDYSWTVRGKNVYGYVEYFRSGFGETDRADYISPNAALAARIERGELYTLARDYSALGAQIELHPLVNGYANLLWNLNDGSRFLQVRGVYDWQQNVRLMAGVNLPHGERGDEYGGIPLVGTGTFAAPGRSLFVRAAYYF